MPGQVYVSSDGGPEELFAEGITNSKEAKWIGNKRSYEFRLYAGKDRKTRLAAVTVTRGSAP